MANFQADAVADPTTNHGAAAPEVVYPEEKASNRHLEEMETKKTPSSQEGEPAAASPEAYYRNFEPIATLGLSDWRHTEKQLVNRLDWTLMPTLW